MFKKLLERLCLIAVLSVFTIAGTGNSFAQSDDLEPPPEEYGMDGSGFSGNGDPLAVQDGYIPSKFVDLSRAYWAVGKFDLADNQAIDNYMMINECELYRRYYHSEFEWAKVRESAREYINKHMAEFPTKFEVMVPVYLGSYDSDKEEFTVTAESMMTETRRIDVIVNGTQRLCEMQVSKEIEGYPTNIIVYLNRPVVFVRLPMSRELAAFFVDYSDRMYDTLPTEVRRKEKTRVAFLRLKVKLIQYKETTLVNSRWPRAVVLTQLDGIEVYADPNKTQLLFRQDIKSKKLRRVKKSVEGGSGNGAATPAAPAPPAEKAPVPMAPVEPAPVAIPERAPSTGE